MTRMSSFKIVRTRSERMVRVLEPARFPIARIVRSKKVIYVDPRSKNTVLRVLKAALREGLWGVRLGDPPEKIWLQECELKDRSGDNEDEPGEILIYDKSACIDVEEPLGCGGVYDPQLDEIVQWAKPVPDPPGSKILIGSCEGESNRQCFEEFQRLYRVKTYSDPDCTQEVASADPWVYGYACLEL